ncbi:LLM class F420-dependent oxidoreductase [Phytohabitans suffuscus]|uniref:LLM class F420-dependent oxidoreductase n=1 Tax=Phytohabitans suffuscus TaxID=624315 RepID=A0A6F8YNP6_9ACTN|nr:LLM class F420-dependent oxidoreductase [Phytohabitans suffuscus]BCB87757.1 LLM class F420-dependent oxidoreductase [Phytohabitans suffuscus]
MRLCIFTEPQEGASYDDLRKVAQRAEECGFDGFFRSDHFLSMDTQGLPGPTDAWLTLAALAVQTSRIRLGTLVSSATFRLPGPLAVAVAQADRMSGGRIEFGLGAGWFEAEHSAYGIPFPPLGERFERLEEQLEIITGLWRTPVGERFTFHGDHYRLTDSPALPKPAQTPGPPVIIGGTGPKRTPALAARYADEFNVPFRTVEETAAVYERVREACAAQGREAPIVLSAAHTVACGRTAAEAKARDERIGGRAHVTGTPAEVVDQIGRYAELGATRFFLQILDLSDLDHLEVLAAEVAPQLP